MSLPQDLKDLAESLLGESQLEALKREQELGELHFADAANKLRIIRRLVEGLDLENEAELPARLIDEVRAQLNQLNTVVQQMQEFRLAQDNAASQHTSLVNQIESLREWFASHVRPHLRGNIAEISDRSAELDHAVASGKDAAAQLQQLLGQVRKLAGEAGANEMSTFHDRQAKQYGRQACRFLFAAGTLVVITVILGMLSFVFFPPPIDVDASGSTQWAEFMHNVLVRIFFVGIAGYVLAFSVRNYRVNKHLQVVNEEKRTALNTYVLFAEAAASEDARTVITAELVRAIFSTPDTGFLNDVPERTVVETPGLLGLVARPGGA